MGDLLEKFAEWWLDALLYVPRLLWQELTDVLASAIVALTPAIIGTPELAMINSLPTGFWWGMDLFAVFPCMGIMLSAAVARFLIRRIPIIG